MTAPGKAGQERLAGQGRAGSRNTNDDRDNTEKPVKTVISGQIQRTRFSLSSLSETAKDKNEGKHLCKC